VAATRLQERPARTRRRSGSPASIVRALLWILVVVFVAGIAFLVLTLPGTLRVERRLQDGRAAMQQARAAVVSGNADAALGRFRAAKVSFDDAAAEANAGALSLARSFPIVGSNIRTVEALARAGSKTASAGMTVADAVTALPNGVASLAPSGGRLPLERYPALARAVGRARSDVASALADVDAVGQPVMLLPPVEDARRLALDSLAELNSLLAGAQTMLERLPAFLGAEGPRTYLFGAANPAEQRGTGGLIGAYALLTADRGRLSFSTFRPIESLPPLNPNSLAPPSADYHRLYDPVRTGNGFWRNTNMTPDFPTAARALEIGYAAATGAHVDGIVVADPFALRALVDATGPARVPGLGVRVTAASVVPFLANQAYARIQKPTERKHVLGDVAEAVVGRFLRDAGGTRSVRDVTAAAAEGHILVFANDAQLESALARTGAGGAFPPAVVPAPTDLLSVIVNNAAGNKTDYYVDRSIRYDVSLDADGSASATTLVAFANHAPTKGVPSYVIGPKRGVTKHAGEDVSIVNVYCGRCRLTSAERDGRSMQPGTDHENGSNLVQTAFSLLAGDSTSMRYTYTVSSAWVGDASGGTYRLAFLDQPTIRATRLQVSVRMPDGMHVTRASAGVQVSGDVATWTGTPERTLAIELSFAPSLPIRLWHQVVG
jgi:hypothetical protein